MHILPPRESEIVAAVIFFGVLSKRDLLSIFGYSKWVRNILRKLETDGVLNYEKPFYSVNSEKLLEMVSLRREELRKELERECNRFSRILSELSILTVNG
jgi:transcription initiation factor IIE alpha subunit